MKPVIIKRFEYTDTAEKYANEMAKEGYRLVSFSSYKDINGTIFVVCMNLAKFERGGDSE
jgi:hypothetical protein